MAGQLDETGVAYLLFLFALSTFVMSLNPPERCSAFQRNLKDINSTAEMSEESTVGMCGIIFRSLLTAGVRVVSTVMTFRSVPLCICLAASVVKTVQ